MASSNPANFANLPKDELKEIAAKGGHASHGAHHESGNSDHPDRNPDGTFTKGSGLAKELGAQGGHAAHHDTTSGAGSSNLGVRHICCLRLRAGTDNFQRNPDGTFKAGSQLAHDLGVKGGHASHEHSEGQGQGGSADDNGRNPDGTFKAGSKLAHDLGIQGGHASHTHQQ
jgi:general stress protein YciG